MEFGERYLTQVQQAFARRRKRERIIRLITKTESPVELKRLTKQLRACERLEEFHPINI